MLSLRLFRALQRLKSFDEPRRQRGVKEVLAIGTSAVPALSSLLRDYDAWHFLKPDIISILERLGDKSAVPALIDALEDQHRDVRLAARNALQFFLGKYQVSATEVQSITAFDERFRDHPAQRVFLLDFAELIKDKFWYVHLIYLAPKRLEDIPSERFTGYISGIFDPITLKLLDEEDYADVHYGPVKKAIGTKQGKLKLAVNRIEAILGIPAETNVSNAAKISHIDVSLSSVEMPVFITPQSSGFPFRVCAEVELLVSSLSPTPDQIARFRNPLHSQVRTKGTLKHRQQSEREVFVTENRSDEERLTAVPDLLLFDQCGENKQLYGVMRVLEHQANRIYKVVIYGWSAHRAVLEQGVEFQRHVSWWDYDTKGNVIDEYAQATIARFVRLLEEDVHH